MMLYPFLWNSLYVFVINYFILEEHVKAQNIEIIITLCTYATAT